MGLAPRWHARGRLCLLQAVKARGGRIRGGRRGQPGRRSRTRSTTSAEADSRGFTRAANRAGGLEGGITNGAGHPGARYLKPISTLRRPLESVDFATREPVLAAYERSDVAWFRPPE